MGDTLVPFPHVIVDRIPHTTKEMKACVLDDDYEQVPQLSDVIKSNLLEKPAYQVFRATSLTNQLAVNHMELLFPDPFLERSRIRRLIIP